MALQGIQGFVTPEQDMRGIYQATAGMEKRNAQAAEQNKEQQASRAANSKFFSNYFDPKDYLTGTHYDPVTTKLLGDAMQQAYDLSSQNVPMEQIMMATAPLVKRASDYTQKAKMYQGQKKQWLDLMGKDGGYNLGKAAELFDKYTFFNDNGEIDVDAADPSGAKAIEKIRENNLGDITTNAGISTFLKDTYKPIGRTENVLRTDRLGNKKRDKVGVTAPAWEMPEEVNGEIQFVPKYQVATDNKIPILHEWKGADGKTVHAPVRLLDEGIYSQLMGAKGSAVDHLNAIVKDVLASGEYKDASGNPIKHDSPQAEMIKRAVAYDYLKGMTSGSVNELKENTLSTPQIRLNVGMPAFPVPQNSGNGSNIGGATGNPFDDITDLSTGGGYSKSGSFFNKDGALKTGKVFIRGEHIPASWKAVMKAAGITPEYLNSGVDANIENGQIVSVSNKNIGTVTRGAMENFAKKFDTERKGEGMGFGNKSGSQKPHANSNNKKSVADLMREAAGKK